MRLKGKETGPGADLVTRLEEHQLAVAVRTETPEQAYEAAKACIRGGVKFVEITFTVPEADQIIKKLCLDEGAFVGAGTVLGITDAKKALKAGAAYIVSPDCDERVVKFVKKEGAVSIPGACTPTEIYRAYKAGADVIKLFPFVEIGGLSFLKAIRGPFPFIKYMLCGGAKMENISAYLAAKPAGVLVGSAILKQELVRAADWDSIAGLAREFVRRINEIRRQP